MRRQGGSLLRSRQGLAALEFAMIAPVLLLMFLASFDTIRYLILVDLARRATISAGNAASNTATNGTTLTPALLTTILKQEELQTPGSIWTGMGTTNGIYLSVVELDSTGNNFRLDTQAKYPASMTSSSVYGCKASTTFAALGPGQTNSGVPNDMFLVSELFYTFKPFVFSSKFMATSSYLIVRDKSAYRIRQPVTPTTGGTC